MEGVDAVLGCSAAPIQMTGEVGDAWMQRGVMAGDGRGATRSVRALYVCLTMPMYATPWLQLGDCSVK